MAALTCEVTAGQNDEPASVPTDVPIPDAIPSAPPPGAPAQTTPAEPASLTVVPRDETALLGQYNLSDTLRTLVSDGVRGQSAMLLLCANSQRIEGELAATGKELATSRAEISRLHTDLSTEQRSCAVLRERLQATAQINSMGRVLVTIGGIMCGVGAQVIIDRKHALILVPLLLIGATMLLCGWFWPNKPSGNT